MSIILKKLEPETTWIIFYLNISPTNTLTDYYATILFDILVPRR